MFRQTHRAVAMAAKSGHALSSANSTAAAARQLEVFLRKQGLTVIRQQSLAGRRFASTEAAAAAAAAGAAKAADGATAVADALSKSATFIPDLPVYKSVMGVYPDYSILQKTGDAGGVVDTMMHWLQLPYEFLHDTMGMPWWGAIVAGTIGFRVILGRSMVRALASGANMQEHMDEIQAFQKRVQIAQQSGDTAAVMNIRMEMRAFMKKRNLNMITPFVPLLQAPLLFSLFWAIGRLGRDAHLIPGFFEGGGLWFPLLTAPDPTMILPAVAVGSTLLSIWTNPSAQGMPAAELTAKGQKVLFSTLALTFSYVTFNFPAALQLYVGTTAFSMLAQQALLRSAAFRAKMNFPENWPPSAERAAAFAKKRGFTMFSSFAPVFRRFSALAEGDFGRFISGAPAVPKQVYVTAFGLRDAGAPPPPPESQQPLFAAEGGNAAAASAVSKATASPAAAAPGSAAPAAPAAAAPHPTHTPPVKVSLSSLKNKGAGKR